MRYDKGHKDETRRHLLKVAAKQFLKNGIDGVGIATIMKEAGLTNGAFYAHFKSKDALVAEVLDDTLEQREKQFLKGSLKPADYVRLYLSPVHRSDVECGCPIAALLSELVRHSKATRQIFTKRIERTAELIASQLGGRESERKKNSISVMAILIGALQMSRAVTSTKLSDEILNGAYETAMKLVSGKTRLEPSAV
jgi:TetR/AcrR family transcriptional repressor of nem operon